MVFCSGEEDSVDCLRLRWDSDEGSKRKTNDWIREMNRSNLKSRGYRLMTGGRVMCRITQALWSPQGALWNYCVAGAPPSLRWAAGP